jgi:hypothetical protein
VPVASGGIPGLSGHRNTIVAKPTLFAMGGGNTGLMGEAGPEAIMPLRRSGGGLGVLATGPGGQSGVLPLKRTPGGTLGVAVPDMGQMMRPPSAFARGGIVGAMPGGMSGGASGMAGGSGAGSVRVVVNNNAPGVKAEARERHDQGGTTLEVIVEQIESALADRAGRGVGALSGVLGQQFGMQRVGR